MKRLSWIGLIAALLALPAGAALAQGEAPAGTPQEICEAATPAEDPETREFEQAEDVLQEGVDYRAVFCTDAGPVYVDLMEDFAPVTVNNFVFLAQNGFYNNTTFHRVLEGFMAQGGDPTGTGTGGPGYQFRDEFKGFLQFDRPGLLAMANANRPEQGIVGTNGSQFFITTSEPDYLNFRHTIFGEVLEGYENVEALRLRDPQENPDFEGSALETVVIVTEPSAVDSTFESELETATREEFAAALDTLIENVPPDLTFGEGSGEFSTEETLDQTPVSLRPDVEAFLEANNHVFRVVRDLTNAECNTQYFFDRLSYTVDAYASEADATAALADGLYGDIAEADGFTDEGVSETFNLPLYRQSATTCDDEPGVLARTHVQRGRYIVTAEVLIREPVLEQISLERLFDQQAIFAFETTLADVYRAELR